MSLRWFWDTVSPSLPQRCRRTLGNVSPLQLEPASHLTSSQCRSLLDLGRRNIRRNSHRAHLRRGAHKVDRDIALGVLLQLRRQHLPLRPLGFHRPGESEPGNPQGEPRQVRRFSAQERGDAS